MKAKRILFTICILFFCLADQRVGSAMGQIQLVYVNAVTVMVGIMILAHYPLRSYGKLPYGIWGGLCLIWVPLVYLYWKDRVIYQMRLPVVLLMAVIYGFVLLRTAYAWFWEKQRPRMHPALIWLFFLFLLTVAFSRYNYHWNLLYFASYLLLYLTPLEKEDYKALGNGIIDGIAIGFFLIQGTADVIRPYDTLRYLGLYSNPNMNALFYQLAYAAFLARFCVLEKQSGKLSGGKFLIKWFSFFMAASLWNYLFLTMCRSAMLGMGAVSIAASIYCFMGKRTAGKPYPSDRQAGKTAFADAMRRGGKVLLRFATMLLLIVGTFPLVYGSVRRLPAYFDSPVYFFEGYSEDRIVKGDPPDSPKYISWQQVLEANFGRLKQLLPQKDTKAAVPDKNILQETLSQDEMTATDMQQGENAYSGAAAADIQQGENAYNGAAAADIQQGENAQKEPAAADIQQEENIQDEQTDNLQEEPKQEENSAAIRLVIYKHYLSSLNLTGHKETENGIQVTEEYYAPHAHDLFLQYAFNYGIPGGILFFLFMAGSFLCLAANCRRMGKQRKPHSEGNPAPFFLFLAILIFGLTEITWRSGMLSNTLLFLLPCFAIRLRRRVKLIG